MDTDIKNKVLLCKSNNPSWGYDKIANFVGCAKSTVRFHIDKKYALHRNQGQKLLRKQRKLILIKKLGGRCSKCGYNKCLNALQFHHKKDKEFDRPSYKKLSVSLEEIKKCELVCANCHFELHS